MGVTSLFAVAQNAGRQAVLAARAIFARRGADGAAQPLRRGLVRVAKGAAVLSTPVGVTTGARYWRSYQTLDGADLTWPNDSCVETFEEALELAERAGLFPNGEVDLEAIRRWHQDRGYLGGVVVRTLRGSSSPIVDREASRPSASSSSSSASPATRNDDEELDVESLCYYMYYELAGHSDFEQQVFVRGTSNRADLAVDLETHKQWDEEIGCYFHAGFLGRADRVLKDLGPLLKLNSVLTLSGHSLGGAVATIMAIKLQARGYTVRRVVTFGAPKFTNVQALGKFSTLPLLRICHEDDVVVGLPPASIEEVLTASWQGVYHHVGKQLLIGSAPGEVCFLASEAAFQWWHHSCWFQFSADMFTYHRLYTYVDRLRELCDGRGTLVPFNECTPRRRSVMGSEGKFPTQEKNEALHTESAEDKIQPGEVALPLATTVPDLRVTAREVE